jgi:plasmid segregation protein ParM
MRTSSVALACDLGYGNLKAAAFDAASGRYQEILLPAGAAEASAMPKIDATHWDLKGGEEVLIDGVPWVAGVEQRHIQNRAKQTHSRYVATDEYYALFLACLSRLGLPRIDVLVTGLPVNQYFGPDRGELVAAITNRLSGRKYINPYTTVDVGAVHVIAQPLGTYMGMASLPQYQALATRDDLRVLCCDFGFGTVDWCCLAGRSVLDKSSDSSDLATSVVLAETARAISSQLHRTVTLDQLDAALRAGRTEISTGLSSSFDFRETLDKKAADVSATVAAQILASVRTAGGIDHVILTGGGASLYAEAMRAAFPGEDRLITADNAVMANAIGYLAVAKHKLSRPGAIRAA